ncbi:MAG: hypothetical protein V3S37_00425, partial [Dehalococcoidia bacterium]
DGNRVRFVQREVFTGALVPFFAVIGFIKRNLNGFKQMNRAIRPEWNNRLDDTPPDTIHSRSETLHQ